MSDKREQADLEEQYGWNAVAGEPVTRKLRREKAKLRWYDGTPLVRPWWKRWWILITTYRMN